MSLPRILPAIIVTVLALSIGVRERIHRIALEKELSAVEGSCPSLRVSRAGGAPANQGRGSYDAGGAAANRGHRGAGHRGEAETEETIEMIDQPEVREPPTPDEIANSNRETEKTLAKMDKALHLSPQVREELRKYQFETLLGLRVPKEDENGGYVDELELILGKEAYQTWQGYLETEENRFQRIEADKQVFFLSREMGLDPQQEERLRTALSNDEQTNSREKVYLGRILDLDDAQERKIGEIIESLDDIVVQDMTQRMDRAAALNGSAEAESEAAQAYDPERVRLLRQQILEERAGSFLTEAQLKKLREYQESSIR